jgi:hypothetical protein
MAEVTEKRECGTIEYLSGRDQSTHLGNGIEVYFVEHKVDVYFGDKAGGTPQKTTALILQGLEKGTDTPRCLKPLGYIMKDQGKDLTGRFGRPVIRLTEIPFSESRVVQEAARRAGLEGQWLYNPPKEDLGFISEN